MGEVFGRQSHASPPANFATDRMLPRGSWPTSVFPMSHSLPKLHNAMWPGLVGKGDGPGQEPPISLDDYMWAHLESLETLAREMPVDILAHPTLVTLPFRDRPIDELWTEEREERIVDALFAAGVAFEISNRYPPHERLVKRAIDRGVRISLGSDGHTLEQVADLAAPLAMARRLGVRAEDIYDPRRHGSKTTV